MSRQSLSHRRSHQVFEFEHRGIRYTAGFGRYSDGRLAEIFLTAPKVGTDLEAAATDSAIVASPADAIRHALGRQFDGCSHSALGAALDIIANLPRPS